MATSVRRESILTNDTKQKLRDLLHNDVDQKQEILKCNNLHEVNVYCKINHLNGQQLGPFTETFLIDKCKMKKNKSSDCIGDCKDRYMKNNEIKASGGGKGNIQFNYVQIRPSHEIDYYILTAFYINESNIDSFGELFIFKINKKDIIQLIFEYGNYAHGTKDKMGPITLEDLNDKSNSKEYALRPIYGNPLWNKLLKFRVSESDL
tara:strand:+ start:1301 stop:1918 length:618 start_codon:yes stop_codon:yes gene_type:complete